MPSPPDGAISQPIFRPWRIPKTTVLDLEMLRCARRKRYRGCVCGVASADKTGGMRSPETVETLEGRNGSVETPWVASSTPVVKTSNLL